jgi:hypothetical protein
MLPHTVESVEPVGHVLFTLFSQVSPVMGPPGKDLIYYRGHAGRNIAGKEKPEQTVVYFLRSRPHTNSVQAVVAKSGLDWTSRKLTVDQSQLKFNISQDYQCYGPCVIKLLRLRLRLRVK